VLRDIDLLKQFDYCDVGFSLMTLDDRLAQQAVSPTRRLQALASLHEQGICTYAFISPYLSRLSDINRLVEALSGSIDEIGVEAINTRGGNWQGVEKVLARHYPALLKDCKRLSKDDDYWMELETQVHLLADQYQIKLLGFFRY
jgi:DNA repair photolyase